MEKRKGSFWKATFITLLIAAIPAFFVYHLIHNFHVEVHDKNGENVVVNMDFPKLDIYVSDPNDDEVSEVRVNTSDSLIKVDITFNDARSCDEIMEEKEVEKVVIFDSEYMPSCTQITDKRVVLEITENEHR